MREIEQRGELARIVESCVVSGDGAKAIAGPEEGDTGKTRAFEIYLRVTDVHTMPHAVPLHHKPDILALTQTGTPWVFIIGEV